MRIQIVGDGIKECALAKALEKHGDHEVVVTPGNEGSRQQSLDAGMDLPDHLNLEDVIGTAEIFQPETILLMDERVTLSPMKEKLEAMDFNVFAPEHDAAELLYNKAKWTEFFDRHGLRGPEHALLKNYDDALNFLQENEGPWVIKEQGGKKRFSISYSYEEAQDLLDDWFEQPGNSILVSPFYGGLRFNIPVLVDGDQIIRLDTMITQRGIYDQEDDPETKGMGAFSPASTVIPQMAIDQAWYDVMIPFFAAMAAEGIPYKGFADGEFVWTGSETVCVNLKCGLAECATASVLMRCRSDLMKLIHSLEKREVAEAEFDPNPAVVVMLAATEYPEKGSYGHPITIDEDVEGQIFPYHTMTEDGVMKTDGGRVIAAADTGKTLKEAARKATETADHIHCDDLFYRHDIGDYPSSKN